MDLTTLLKNYPKLLLYDGDCGMCQFSVRFLIKHNEKKNIYFASLQSPIGVQLKKHYQLEHIDSIIYIRDEKAFYYAEGVLLASQEMTKPWSFLQYLRYIPYFISNSVYKFIAKYRKRWIKTPDHCPLYPAEIRQRFLDGMILD